MASPQSGAIPNLVNGVSQQSPALRLPSQAEAQENFYSTIVTGLKDRPPAELVAKLKNSLASGAFTHIINRDVTERYVVVSDGTTVEVYDFAGTAKTVNAPGGYGYLSSVTNPATDMVALTIHDYTFIVNRKATPAAGATLSPVRPHEALINVYEGNYGKKYNVIVNGTSVASYTTSTTDVTTLDTAFIATQLYNALVTAGYNTSPWSVTRYQNAVYLKNTTTDFTISVEDGFNGNAMKAIKGKTQHFSDLPYYGPDGFVCEIMGDDSTAFDNYWVQIDASSGSTTVVWKEVPAPGLPITLDGTTMPHTLVRESDGTFTFAAATWDQRKCGDDSISPMPSFVGTPIENVYFHHDRMAFISGENIILSRTSSFFDFFRTSATALLDDDPIDVGAAHNKVSLLKSAVGYQKQLIVFSDQTQFLLSGNGDQLSAKTVSFLPITEYVSDPVVHPVAIGQSIFFAAVRGDWESLWEFTINYTANGPLGDASEVTDAAPSYIPSGAYRMVGTSNESVLAMLTSGDPSAMYIYRYFYQDSKKVQSSLSRWTIPDATVLNVEFINSELYAVVSRSDGVFLEKFRMQPAVTDTDLGFLVHLDRRVHTDQLAAPTYDATANATTYTLPYMPGTGTVAVTSSGNVAVLPALQLTVSSYTGTTITLPGDTRTYPIWFGNTYERRYRFSQFFVRQPNGAGGTISLTGGRLQVKHLVLAYNDTAYFTVEVTPEGRAKRTYTFTGRALGDPTDLLGIVPISAGSKSIPILSRSDRVTIEIVNDSWMPSAFVNALWKGSYNPNAKDY